MLSFESDYIEGAHEKIMERLLETNFEQLSGYGNDIYCERAKEKIRAACECPDADIYFLSGGTQTNAIAIDSLLAPYEGVISAETGHIGTHEAGAIEYTGHKILSLPHHEGKIHADELEAYLRNFWQDANHEHMVFPGMVYISYPTEYGTLYSRAELEDISAICRANHILLYLDGARLGYGLMSSSADLTLPLIAEYCDVFYIGGTKVGALCGEALVFAHCSAPKHFTGTLKRHGALLAKGRLLGIQFDTLFTDELYFKISRHAIRMAELLKEGFQKRGYTFYLESPTNQQFIVLEDEEMERLKSQVAFGFWEKPDDDHTVVRFATSWATKETSILQLMELIDRR